MAGSLLPSPPEEAELGIGFYTTRAPGCGGRLKEEPEDFVVVERTKWPRESPDGAYLALAVRARNWETNRLVGRLARAAHVSRTRVGFAGTKDKRAVTTQGFTVRLDGAAPPPVALPDVEVLRSFRAVRALSLGDLESNAFEVAVTGLSGEAEGAAASARAVAEEARAQGGFPNFFGTQRFGSLRPVTHRVGSAMVDGDFARAVALYLETPSAFEPAEVQAFRRAAAAGRDPAALLKEVPQALDFERQLLEGLARAPDRPLDALLLLPRNLLLMFIHAHQSELFNRILSERLRRGLPLDRPNVGDIVVPLEERGSAIEGSPVRVVDGNASKVERQVRAGRAAVTGLVPGLEAPFAEGEMGEIERAVMERAGRGRESFVVPEAARFTTKGVRRPLAMRPGGLAVEAAEVRDAPALKLAFELPRGCYATVLLREVLKRPESAWAGERRRVAPAS